MIGVDMVPFTKPGLTGGAIDAAGLATLQQTIVNFRDFGGARSRFGGIVARGRLYRSGHLANADSAAIAALHGLGFALVGDLRYPGERLREPSPWPDAWASRVISHDNEADGEAPHLDLLRSGDADEAAVAAFYLDLYAQLPFRPDYAELFARVLRNLAAEPEDSPAPALIHCTAGKDRTGILVALLQHLLGVAPGEIVAEYLRSHHAPALMRQLPHVATEFELRHGVRPPLAVFASLMEARAEFLETSFDAMTARCGSVDGYLRSIGIDDAQARALRARLLLV